VVRLLRRLAPVLHLTRITTAFALVANTWFVILWTRANGAYEGQAGPPGRLSQGPLWALLAGGALVALGLFAFGACVNDILDVKRDRTLRPERPLVSGQIGMHAALTLVFFTVMASFLGATVFGTEAVIMTATVLIAIFAFNAAGRFIPAIGLVTLGLIHAGYMLIPNVQMKFLWPVWLAMTHSLAVAAATHRMSQKVPKISRRAAAATFAGWVFWSGVIAWLQWDRNLPHALWPGWVDRRAALWPAALLVIFLIVAWGKARGAGPGPRAAEKVGRYGSLWLALYTCAWLVGTGHENAALILTGLATCAFLGMTVLREVYGLLEQPMGYRR
jgi:hypothetical protein